MILKPHSWTPLDAFELARAASDAGLSPGAFNVITGGAAVGEELTTHPMVDMITFTGSTATGRRIKAAAAPTVKRVQLELGGKSASIILDDVSEQYSASRGILTSMIHAGQGCAIHTRLLLPEHPWRGRSARAMSPCSASRPACPTTGCSGAPRH